MYSTKRLSIQIGIRLTALKIHVMRNQIPDDSLEMEKE